MKRLVVLALLAPMSVWAQESAFVISHQGRLLGADDAPVTGTKSLTISLYPTDDAETAPWSETYQVDLANGNYALLLGDTRNSKRALTGTEAAANPFLSVTIDGVELSPRLRMGSSPTAARAGSAAHADDADKLGNVPASAYAQKDFVEAQVGVVDDKVVAVDAKLGALASLSGASFTGNVSVPEPTASAHATTKSYVDGKISSSFGATPSFAPSSGNVPFSVAAGATGLVSNLNAELLGGHPASDFVLASEKPAVLGVERVVLNFDEEASSGTAVSDGSGAANDGSFPPNTLTRTTSGRQNTGALNFVAGGGLVTVPDSDSLDITNNLTLEAWIFPTAAPAGEGVIVEKGGAYGLRLTNSLQVQAAFVTRASGSENYGTSSPAVPLNTWTHVAATYDGLQIRTYLNGVLSALTNAPGGPVNTTDQALWVGGRANAANTSFVGTIDSVRVSASAKSFVDYEPAFAMYGAASWTPNVAGDNVVPWGKSFQQEGITRTGNNLRFARAGVYLITVGARISGTGDVWMAWGLAKNGTVVAQSNGFGAVAGTDQGQQAGTFLATVDSTTADYQIVFRKATAAGTVVDSQWGDFSGTRATLVKVSR